MENKGMTTLVNQLITKFLITYLLYRHPPPTGYPVEAIPLQLEGPIVDNYGHPLFPDGQNLMQFTMNPHRGDPKLATQTLNRYPNKKGPDHGYERPLPPVPGNNKAKKNMAYCNGVNGTPGSQTLGRPNMNFSVTPQKGYNTLGHVSNGNVNHELMC